MKRLGLWLVALSVASATPALAQRTPIAKTNVEALQQISSAAAKDYKANRGQAIKLAKEKGWVIEKTYANGSHVSLQGLDSKGLPIYYITYNNSRAAATTKTDQLWAGGSLGLTLSGSSSAVNEKLGVWDGGRVRNTHQELRDRVIQKDNADQAFNSHATHVSGTLMGSGVSQYAKGMAHGLKTLQAYDFNSDRAEMAAAAATGLLVSNHSYGTIAGWRQNPERTGTPTDPIWEWWGDTEISDSLDYKFGYYDGAAAEWDKIAYSAPYYLIVKSSGNNRGETGPKVNEPFYRRNKNGSFTVEQGRPAKLSSNNGYDIISTYGNAKNILTVGAVNPIAAGYNQPSDVAISSFSSYGPTDDGRIKPDLVGNGVSVLSSTGETDQTYSSYNGTSMASPNVAGSLLLLQEHHANLKAGAVMRAATLKGLAIHTADEAGNAPGPDYIYGWGLLNASKAANLLTNAFAAGSNKKAIVEERTLKPGDTYQLSVVASGDGALAFTISWTDPEASALLLNKSVLNNPTPRLVNDLDIRVSDGTDTYLPWILDPRNPANPASKGDNILDNVEQILIQKAIPGKTYTVTVSHKGTLKKETQDYSLIVSGSGGTAYGASKATSDAGSNIQSIAIGTFSRSFPADACTTYRNITDSGITFEPGQTKALTIEAGACGASAGKIAKAFIDWNLDGDFADAQEEVTLTGTTTLSASITAPGTVSAGMQVLMRIVLQETNNSASVLPVGTFERGETQDHYIQITRQQQDVGIVNVIPLGNTLCANPAQELMVRLQNFGAAAQKNIPVTVIVKKNGVEIAQLSSTYARTLAAFSTDEFILNGSFASEPGASYEFTATTSLQGDAVPQNDSYKKVLVAANLAAAPTVSAFRCGPESGYTLTSSVGNNTFWYTSLTSKTPIAAGNIVVEGSKIPNGSLYAATADFSATIGPASKSFASGGGYNQFGPDVLVSAKAPVMLESARLYIGHSGKITFTVYTLNGIPVSSRTLNVEATRTPAAADAQADDLTDKGAVYYLGLEIPASGDYKIGIQYEDKATIYRNNAGVTGYPFGISDVFTITGNTASTGSTGYYYYFYDLKVKAIGCKSERVAVNVVSGTPIPKPVAQINGHALESNEETGNNWYLNGVEIPEAKGKTFTPTVTGAYSVKVMRDGCISVLSDPIDFVYEPKKDLDPNDLTVYPNPSGGVFNLWLQTSKKEDITFEVRDMMGKLLFTDIVKQKYGHFKGVIDFKPTHSGVYILKVQHGTKTYVRKLVVQK